MVPEIPTPSLEVPAHLVSLFWDALTAHPESWSAFCSGQGLRTCSVQGRTANMSGFASRRSLSQRLNSALEAPQQPQRNVQTGSSAGRQEDFPEQWQARWGPPATVCPRAKSVFLKRSGQNSFPISPIPWALGDRSPDPHQRIPGQAHCADCPGPGCLWLAALGHHCGSSLSFLTPHSPCQKQQATRQHHSWPGF